MLTYQSLKQQLGRCGLGLRREFLHQLLNVHPHPVDFLEITPENWLGIGGRRQWALEAYAEQYPMVCHGLSLSIGGLSPIDYNFLKKLKQFFTTYDIAFYSEHLSFCSDEKGHLYDLMPMPFSEEAVYYVADRVKQVQSILERQIALENISYYASLDTQLTESDFICAVLDEADCLLLLDMNNVYVNSVNHNYDPQQFLYKMPVERIAYCHIAGHSQSSDALVIDTHGAEVIAPVWELLVLTYQRFGEIPTVLERDSNVPALDQLLQETLQLKSVQAPYRERMVCDV